MLDYIQSLLKICPETELNDKIARLFTLTPVKIYNFPDSSLALTSSLGNIYLPHLAATSSDKVQSAVDVLAINRSWVHITLVRLLKESSFLIVAVQQLDTNFVNHFFAGLFLHCTFTKDLLANPKAMSNCLISVGFSETELLDFQSDCFALFNQVPVFSQFF